MSEQLDLAAANAVREMKVPESARSVYPAIHAAAYAIDWPNKSEALGAVFRVVATACGVRYGSQYMDRVIMARHKDGTLQGLLRSIP